MADNSQVWPKIIARAWADDDFKARLLADAGPIVEEYGIGGLDHYHVKVIEDPNASAGDWHIQGRGKSATYIVSIPPRPSGELSDSDLENVAGAGCCCCCCSSASASDEIL